MQYKFEYEELTNQGFTKPNPDEEDSKFEEDRFGFMVKKVCRIASTNKEKDEQLGEMRKRRIAEFADIFKREFEGLPLENASSRDCA